MSELPEWYVITGGPSSGKTTIISRLSEKGYYVVPEAARILIDNELALGKSLEEIRINELEFQRKVLKLKIEIESKTPQDKIVLFDRAMPDSIAYYKVCEGNADEVMRFCKEKRYKKIFFLEQLPFEKDYARIEDEMLANKLSMLLKQAYMDLNYDVVSVPPVDVDERLKLILSEIR
ncbi:MAG: ATP-binding protein [Candidatus Omnitrophica bacterium]|nr:ATP-binding protein [Candidatus Omnitrophota bacterium]